MDRKPKLQEKTNAFKPFIPDGADEKPYTTFGPNWYQLQKGLVNVPSNAKLLVIDRVNPGTDLDNYVLLGPGLHYVNPLFSKSILVPVNATSIDYSPDSNDVGGFRFHTDVENSGCDIELDPAIRLRIVNPMRYLFYSNNPLDELKDLMISVISGWVAKKDVNYIKQRQKIGLNEIDPTGILNEFAAKCGLEILDFYFKNSSLPKEIEEARMKTEVAKEGVKTAEYNRKIKKFESETDRQIMDEALAQGMKYGYSGQELLEFVKMYTNMWLARTPGAQVFVNTSGQQLSGAEMLLQQISGRLGNNNSNNNQQQIIDADAREIDVDDAENLDEFEPKKYTKRRL